jgi:hypothetical protein
MRKGGHLQWEGVVRSLQVGEGMPLHVGGRFALSLQGHEHYLASGRCRGDHAVWASNRRVGWASCRWSRVSSTRARERSIWQCLSFAGSLREDVVGAWVWLGIQQHRDRCAGLLYARARHVGTVRQRIADAAGVYEADALMQAMTTLRPQRIGLLLRCCRSIKAKRLFLALADRHRHAWLAHVSLEDVDLGRGKRALVPGGRLHPTYQITLPGDLDEHLA